MVTVLGVLGTLAVLFAAGALATREGGVLVPAGRDRPDLDLPAGRLAPDDLHRVRFSLALRGYRMSDVDETMDRAALALTEEQARVRRLEVELGRRADTQRSVEVQAARLQDRLTGGAPAGPPVQVDPRDEGLPLLSPDEAAEVRALAADAFRYEGLEVSVHPAHLVDQTGWQWDLSVLAATCSATDRVGWPAVVQEHVHRVLDED